MSGWDGNGNFTRIYSWVADKLAGINITASRMDADTDNITQNGFGNCVTRDGQGSASADQPMNGFRHTDVGDASLRDQYVPVGQLVDGKFTYATSVSGTGDAIVCDFTPQFNLPKDGMILRVMVPGANSLINPTLKASNTLARTIKALGAQALGIGAAGGYNEDQICFFQFVDGSPPHWELINPATSGGAAIIQSGNLLLTTTPLTIDLSHLTQYTRFELTLSGFIAAGAPPTMLFSIDGGGAFLNSNYSWRGADFAAGYTGTSGIPDTSIKLGNPSGASPADFIIEIFGINQAVGSRVQAHGLYNTQSAIYSGSHATTNIDAIRIACSSTCSAGKYTLVGYP